MKYPHLYVRESSDNNIDTEFLIRANGLISDIEEFPGSDSLLPIRQSVSIAWRLKELGHDDEASEILELAISDFRDLLGEEVAECPYCGSRWSWDDGFSYCPYDGNCLVSIYAKESNLYIEACSYM